MGNSNSGHDKRLNEEKKTLKRCFKKLSECQSSPDCETEKVKNPLSQTNNLKLYGILGGSPLGGLGSQSGARGAGGVFGF